MKMGTIGQDLRYAVRMLLNNPGFSFIAISALALGIGANTAIFSVVNSVLLRPLPYQDPDRIVRVFSSNSSRGWSNSDVSLHDFVDWQQQNHVFSSIAAFNPGSVNLSSGTRSERVDYARVTSGFFSVLGAEPILGRAFLPQED